MRLSDQIREEMEDGHIVVADDGRLLPTPSVSNQYGNQRNGRGEDLLPGVAERLLPTPSAAVINDGESLESWHARRERVAEKGYNGNGMGMPLTIAVQQLFPTPTTDPDTGNGHARYLAGEVKMLPTPNAALATSGPDAGRSARGAGGDDLATTVSLLPTTTAMDAEASGNGTGVTLTDVLQRGRRGTVSDVDWGEYEPAIRRWESVTGRPAPSPVRFDGRDGKPRLNPEFTEWMMGWPAGWLTDETDDQWRDRLRARRAGLDARPIGMRGSVARVVIGLTRAEQLRAAGNGVVTLQASLALRELLSREGVPDVR